MEIRALTGFDKSTRKQYGRSYTPLNGMKKTALGSPIGFMYYSQGTLNNIKNQDIPTQDVEVQDESGRKRIITIDNANSLISLIERGFKLVQGFRNRAGTNVTIIPDYSPSGDNGDGGSGDGGKKAGINITTALGGAIAAYLLFSLLMSKK